MELSNVHRVYFIGAGGIGMSALVRYFLHKGNTVSGYDKTPTPLTTDLIKEGAAIHFEDNTEQIDKEAELVIYTPAIPKDHGELNWYKANGFTLYKRSDVLQMITQDMYSICVGGTHGKTTISTMTAHLLRHSGFGCTAFLGGISVNYNANFWSNRKDVCVVEADEYDRSFHKLSPSIAVISSMDPDHLDIYGTAAAMEEAFVVFANRTKHNGTLLYKNGLDKLGNAEVETKLTYHLTDKNADAYVDNLVPHNGGYNFYAHVRKEVIKDLHLSIGGLHNVENALVAVVIAKTLNISNEKIKAALADFKGVRRRFEYVLKNERHVVIDDYAHHPAELTALIKGARSNFPDRKITIVFQPHLYSRTRDLADEFAAALDAADEIILLPVYPARELPVEGVTSNLILKKMKNINRIVLDKNDLEPWIKTHQPELLLMSGAGDIDAMVKPVAAILEG